MSYFISPPVDSFVFDKDEFVRAVSMWEDVKVCTELQLLKSPRHHTVEFEMPTANGKLYGALDDTFQLIHLDGSLEDCANFAVWVRDLVPKKIMLLFYDENYLIDFPLYQLTRQEQVVAAFASAS